MAPSCESRGPNTSRTESSLTVVATSVLGTAIALMIRNKTKGDLLAANRTQKGQKLMAARFGLGFPPKALSVVYLLTSSSDSNPACLQLHRVW
jgi:hypothetical protein